MTKEEYLSQLRGLKKEIRYLEEREEELKEKMRYFRNQLSHMPKAPSVAASRIEEGVCKVETIQEEIRTKRCALELKRQEILDTIDKLDYPWWREVLRLRYVQELRWKTICYRMQKTRSTVNRYHKVALEHLDIGSAPE